MLTSDFEYELPAEAIAQYPVERGTSRLLVLAEKNAESHQRIADLPTLLRPGDLLVVNDTRVLPARLFGRRQAGGGQVEVLLLEKRSLCEWDALLRPGRRQKVGTRISFGSEELTAEVLTREASGLFRLGFSEPIEPHLETLGHLPLPPYIQRSDESDDHKRYQTVYASRPGAIAAPTAGLHFTEELLEKLAAQGVGLTRITLHVGLGTFRPISTERVEDHQMHSERFEVTEAAAAAINSTRAKGGRIVAVGTTVVRTLETLAAHGEIQPASGRSELFITPGYRFRAIDLLLTNFHLPRSTLLMLVCAMGGQQEVLSAYREAIAHDYRFYSYGDAMLVPRKS